MVHAVDTATGQAIWTHQVDDQEHASIWSSPVVWNGVVYVGVASVAKQVGFRGSVVALNAQTGEQVWKTFTVPEGADGAGVFAVPAIDERRGMLYVGTQNAYSEHDAPYGNPISIVALDASSGDIKWTFNAPPNDGKKAPTDDVGFSASPNLFTATVDGVDRDLVGGARRAATSSCSTAKPASRSGSRRFLRPASSVAWRDKCRLQRDDRRACYGLAGPERAGNRHGDRARHGHRRAALDRAAECSRPRSRRDQQRRRLPRRPR